MPGRNYPARIEFDPASLGPAMQALTPLQRAFVYGIVHSGLSARQAAKFAGSQATTSASLGQTAYQLSHHPGVQQAIEEESRKLMRREAPRSIRTLIEIRDDKAASNKDRLKAAEMLLNRAGMNAVSESRLTVEHHNLSDAEKDREILRLAKELGLGEAEAQKLLIAPDDFKQNAEGVFEIAKPEPKPMEPRRETENETRRRRRSMTPEEIAEDKARVRAAHRESKKQWFDEFWKQRRTGEAGVTDAEFEEVTPETDPLADLRNVL